MTERDEVFGSNMLRLTPAQWACTLVLSTVLLGLAPSLWFQAEGLDSSNDYRIPYEVSKDYALYEQHLKVSASDSNAVFLVGDSVVWGEYVRKEGTLSHFLGERDVAHTYVNAGINGLFPLALEGLVTYYGQVMSGRKVLLHCNLLWMSSPEADLSTDKEQVFNHVELVPQFRIDIPCYRADVTERTARVVQRWVPYLRWVRHLQVAHFDARSIPEWTLRDDGKYPPSYPNAYKNPWWQLEMRAPQEPDTDRQRRLESERHRPWSESGRGPQSFAWVPMEQSLQWAAFQRLTKVLVARGNQVLVVVGPFNEHMISPDNRDRYQTSKRVVEAWLQEQNIAAISPEALPSGLYGDASHPLTDGYRLLAERLFATPGFQKWRNE